MDGPLARPPLTAALATRHEAGYLRYEPAQPEAGGMSHWLSNLQCLVAEALDTGRLAVLPPLGLSRRHNFGVGHDWRWETYFDLRAGRMLDADCDVARPLPLAGRVPAHPATTLSVASGAPIPAAAAACEMVVRRVGPLYREHVPPAARSGAVLWLPPSATVLALARPVVERLSSLAGGYAAVHVRRGDRVRWRRRWRAGTSAEGIRRKLRRHGVAPDDAVFLLSDERDPGFFSALNRSVRLFRYADFPHLAAVVDGVGPQRPDNYLLYEAETEIMRHARLRIGTLAGLGRLAADDWLLDARAFAEGALLRRAGDRLADWRRRAVRLWTGDAR